MEDILLEVGGAVASVAVAYIAYLLRNRLNVDLDRERRDALHTALTNGLRLGMQKKLTGEALLDLAVDYARTFSPMAVAEAERNLRGLNRNVHEIAEALLPSVSAVDDKET